MKERQLHRALWNFIVTIFTVITILRLPFIVIFAKPGEADNATIAFNLDLHHRAMKWTSLEPSM
jgi:hypothetical protein